MHKPHPFDFWHILATWRARAGAVFTTLFTTLVASFRRLWPVPVVFSQRILGSLFVVAFIVGACLKALANNGLTMGHDDYRLAESQNALDMNQLQSEMLSQSQTQTQVTPVAVPEGKVCTE